MALQQARAMPGGSTGIIIYRAILILTMQIDKNYIYLLIKIVYARLHRWHKI